jgi:HK97 family phage major capsid protein
MSQTSTAEALKKAREQRATALKNFNAVTSRLGTDDWNEETDRLLLDTERRNYDDALKIYDDLTEKLSIESKLAEQRHLDDKLPVTINVLPHGRIGDKWGQKRDEFRLIRAYQILAGNERLDGLEAEMHQEGLKEVRALKLPGSSEQFVLPEMLVGGYSETEKRDILAETTTAGGFTVQTSVQKLIPILEPKLQVEALGATVMRGLRDNMDFPRNDADAAALWASEVASATETSPTFDRVQMNPERLCAFTDVSKQNLRQTTIAMETFVRQRLNFAVRKALDSAAINGSGSSDQPLGILNTSGVNDITIGTDGGPLTWALTVLFETETATDNADFGKLAYLTTPAVAGKLKTTEKASSTAQFIWTGNNGDTGDINGYKARVSTQVPSTLSKGASSGILHAMIFGNWEELMIGQWGGVELLINPYTKGKEAIVEFIVNSWWDVAVKHAASFCICNEINPA